MLFHVLKCFNDFLTVCLKLMQESERESQKKWSPVVEINYRGGVYVGRCQGGLPEGKVINYFSPHTSENC